MSKSPDRRETAATRLRDQHAPAGDGPLPGVAVVLIGLASAAAILGLHRLGLLSGRFDVLVASLLLTPVWIMWRLRRTQVERFAKSFNLSRLGELRSRASRRTTGSGRGVGNPVRFRVVNETDGIRVRRTRTVLGDTTPPVRLPRRVRRRRGLPRDRGTLAPADPAEYWRHKRARQEQDRLALDARARRRAAQYAPWPWRQWHAPAPLDELTAVPGRPGHYGVPSARDLWIWADGDWQPLPEQAGGVLSPPGRGPPVRVYGARFDWDERYAPVYWVEIGPDGVLNPTGHARPDENP